MSLVKYKSGPLLLSLAVLDALLDVEQLILLVLLGLLLVGLFTRLLVQVANSSTRQNWQWILVLLSLLSLLRVLFQDTLIVCWQDLHESWKHSVKVLENASRHLRASVVEVVLNQATQESNLLWLIYRTQLDHLLVDLALKVLVQVQHIRDTARHTSCEVPASVAKTDDATASHVLAAMVTHTFDDSRGTGVAYCETLCSHTTEEAEAARSTVQADIADNDVLLSLED